MSKNTQNRADSFANDCRQIIFRLAGERYLGFVKLYMAWPAVVGTLLAEKSMPIKLDEQILYVAVSNNTWMQELVLLKNKIKQELTKKSSVAVIDIIFTIRTRK